MPIKTKLKSAVKIYKYYGLKSFFQLFFGRYPDIDGVWTKEDEYDKSSFYNHSKALSQRYDPATPVTIDKISDNLLVELQELIKTVGDESIKKCMSQSQIYNNLILGQQKEVLEEQLDLKEEPLIVHPLHLLDPLLGPIYRLHKEIRTIFADHIKSPFAFVNTRAWSSRPNSGPVGGNQLHTDGFKPGHMKIMIYLTPLNEEYGALFLENKKITNYPKGTCVCFLNSSKKLVHAGVPGTKYLRTAIEVTIMRAFIDSPQFYNGHFFGRHYTSPEVVYQISNKLVNKFAKKSNIEPFNEHEIVH